MFWKIKMLRIRFSLGVILILMNSKLIKNKIYYFGILKRTFG